MHCSMHENGSFKQCWSNFKVRSWEFDAYEVLSSAMNVHKHVFWLQTKSVIDGTVATVALIAGIVL